MSATTAGERHYCETIAESPTGGGGRRRQGHEHHQSGGSTPHSAKGLRPSSSLSAAHPHGSRPGTPLGTHGSRPGTPLAAGHVRFNGDEAAEGFNPAPRSPFHRLASGSREVSPVRRHRRVSISDRRDENPSCQPPGGGEAVDEMELSALKVLPSPTKGPPRGVSQFR